jgi:DNA-binding transcriptional MerR regulator
MEKKSAPSVAPIPEKLYYKIGEVSQITGVEPYVLRYWESEFKIINPVRTNSKQRLFRKRDLELILEVKKLLYKEKFTIAGAKKRLQEIKGLREKQLKLELPERRYYDGLLRVKKELQDLHGLLS